MGKRCVEGGVEEVVDDSSLVRIVIRDQKVRRASRARRSLN